MKTSGSNLHRFLECQFVESVDWEPSAPGPAALRGTALHAEIAGALSGRPLVSPDLFAWRDWSSSQNWTGARAEFGVAYDLATGRVSEIDPRGGAAYERRQGRLVGTVDCLAGNRLYDWKTGRVDGTAPAADNVQLAFYSLCCAKLFGLEEVRAALVFTGPPVVEDSVVLDTFALGAFEHRLRRTFASPNPNPLPGKHCQYCPAAHTCPSVSQALATIHVGKFPVVGSGGLIQSDEHARDMYATLRLVKERCEAGWKALREYLDLGHEIVLPSGKRYVRSISERETIDHLTSEALELLRAELGAHWSDAITVSSTKTAIKAASSSAAREKQTTGKALEDRILARLRELGCARKSTSVRYEEK